MIIKDPATPHALCNSNCPKYNLGTGRVDPLRPSLYSRRAQLFNRICQAAPNLTAHAHLIFLWPIPLNVANGSSISLVFVHGQCCILPITLRLPVLPNFARYRGKGPGPPSNANIPCFWPTQYPPATTPNGSLIASAVFAQYTLPMDRPTDRQTERNGACRLYYLAEWSGLVIMSVNKRQSEIDVVINDNNMHTILPSRGHICKSLGETTLLPSLWSTWGPRPSSHKV